MVIRSILTSLVLALALAGCKHPGMNRKQPAVASSAAVSADGGAPRNLFLRGAIAPAEQPVAAMPVSMTAPPVTMTGLDQEPYRLDSGDKLRVVVFGQENLSRIYSVDGGGFISMPLIGAVQARGLTTFALEKEIAGQLRTKYVKDPKVTVEISTYRPFFILGEVKNPGQFAYVADMTVQTAVAIAGGYTERARERKVKITRRINGQEVTFKVGNQYSVRPGDTIYVTERLF